MFAWITGHLGKKSKYKWVILKCHSGTIIALNLLIVTLELFIYCGKCGSARREATNRPFCNLLFTWRIFNQVTYWVSLLQYCFILFKRRLAGQKHTKGNLVPPNNLTQSFRRKKEQIPAKNYMKNRIYKAVYIRRWCYWVCKDQALYVRSATVPARRWGGTQRAFTHSQSSLHKLAQCHQWPRPPCYSEAGSGCHRALAVFELECCCWLF